MKVLKKVVLFAVGALALLAVIGLLLPAQSRVERSVLIDAPAETVFPLVNNFREFNRWSPWAKRDPDTQYRFEGPESGVGAKLYWDSEQLRAGSQEIVESETNRRVATVLTFGDQGGEQDRAQAAFTLEPEGRGVKVTWTFEAGHGLNPVSRYLGVMMNAWVGADYEEGLANLKALAESLSAVLTEEIDYAVNGEPFKGFLAYSRNAGKRPGVLVVHEWWGHNDYARNRARQLAELGYTAFALDMYGAGKTADHPRDAQKLMMEIIGNNEVSTIRFNAALNVLKNHPMTDAGRIAAIGYCLGGGVVLSMARTGADLDGVVSFHGGLGGLPEPEADKIKAKFLVLNGAEDPFVSPVQIDKFKQEMEAAGADFEFINYEGALHSFTNPGADVLGEKFDMPLKYDAAADADSWKRMQAFFDEIFK